MVLTLLALIEEVNGLPDTSLKNQEMKGPLTDKINETLSLIEAGWLDDAIVKLQHDSAEKTDGCHDVGAPDKNDWITTCIGQDLVCPLIVQAIDLLNTMM